MAQILFGEYIPDDDEPVAEDIRGVRNPYDAILLGAMRSLDVRVGDDIMAQRSQVISLGQRFRSPTDISGGMSKS